MCIHRQRSLIVLRHRQQQTPGRSHVLEEAVSWWSNWRSRQTRRWNGSDEAAANLSRPLSPIAWLAFLSSWLKSLASFPRKSCFLKKKKLYPNKYLTQVLIKFSSVNFFFKQMTFQMFFFFKKQMTFLIFWTDFNIWLLWTWLFKPAMGVIGKEKVRIYHLHLWK